MKKIILHIGFGKTGTSSIQHMLYTGKDILQEQGILYPSKEAWSGAHHNYVTPLWQEKNGIALQSRYLIEAALDELNKSNCNTLVLSSEILCYVSKTYVAELSDIFDGYNVEIIFYIREQSKLIESAFLQHVKEGREHWGSLDKFIKYSINSFNFMTRITPWACVFGHNAIKARLFDKRIIGNDVCKDFLHTAGLPSRRLTLGIMENESLIPEMVDSILLLDRTNPDNQERKEIVDCFLKVSNIVRKESSKRLLDANKKEWVKQYFSQSNEEFSRLYLDSMQSKIFSATSS